MNTPVPGTGQEIPKPGTPEGVPFQPEGKVPPQML
jgi:hypothetical protein